MSSLRTTAAQVCLAILLTATLVPWSAEAEDAASPIAQVRRGERVAQEQCSACHVVAKKQQFLPLLKQSAPSFQSIADRPQTSEMTLREFLATTHWDGKTVPITMPNPHLSNADGAVVSRYILSLKGR
jgi:mono/diheme cytochrome c family protein